MLSNITSHVIILGIENSQKIAPQVWHEERDFVIISLEEKVCYLTHSVPRERFIHAYRPFRRVINCVQVALR
jgi:hypothetical protein